MPGFGVKYAARVKPLGIGLGAGVRLHTKVLKDRLHHFTKRMKRYRALWAAGVNTAKLLRTGGSASFTYGEYATGVASSTLQNQRRVVASAGAPLTCTGGQNLNLALIMMDGSPTGHADPAFQAHSLPIGFWSMAVWNQWVPLKDLNFSV